jgi:PAS domain S-box-containing protein
MIGSTHSTPPFSPLSDEDQQFRILVQSITDYAIYMLDPFGYIQSWNAGGQRIKGYSRDEIVGQHFSRFYSEDDQAIGLPELGLKTAREEGKYESEGWRYRKNGSRFRASVIIDPIWLENEFIGYAKITRDITARYEAELRLEETQRALAQSQKLEAVGKFTFGLAHDFNNLLTVVVNSLDLISLYRTDQSRTEKLIAGAMRAADRGTLLTRQLLAFGRGQELAPERHNVNLLLERSRDLYRRACDTSVTITFDLTSGLPSVLVDATAFEAAILNLVVNSRDAMFASGEIVISTHRGKSATAAETQPSATGYVCISVSDNGTGMSPDTCDRATEPFFTTKEIGKGSGLGLSQVYGFAKQSGGFVNLRSEVGKGTEVLICLPAVSDPSQ